MNPTLKRFLAHRLVWPIAALLVLVIINTIARPSFISITVQNGQLYGPLIDILRIGPWTDRRIDVIRRSECGSRHMHCRRP